MQTCGCFAGEADHRAHLDAGGAAAAAHPRRAIPTRRWPAVLTLPAPVLMTLLLTKGSGARILERHMSSRPGWAEYAARTSAFVPWPPKKAPRATD